MTPSAIGLTAVMLPGVPAQHPIRLLPYRLHVGGAVNHSDHGRLTQHDPFALDMDAHVCRPEIDPDHQDTLPEPR